MLVTRLKIRNTVKGAYFKQKQVFIKILRKAINNYICYFEATK